MGYAVKILADSISPAGHRLTTFEATFPRMILSEINTHCMLSRSSASSRARPTASVIAAVREDPFIPEAFGRNQKGMQPGEALEGRAGEAARESWLSALTHALGEAEYQANVGVHKQYANRLLEPFAWHTAVITATDVDNLFNLRVNPLAQGEFQTIARMMEEAREAREPRAIGCDAWHLPYIAPSEAFDLEVGGMSAADVAALSVVRCARVSYDRQGQAKEDDLARYAQFIENGHMAPLEHVARPMTELELAITLSYDMAIDDGPILRWRWGDGPPPRAGETLYVDGRERDITYARGPLHYAGKLNGWISRRQFVRGEHDILGYRKENAT